jgi:UDP-glucose 4-epimerase
MYFTVVDNILSEMNKRFNDNIDFLTAISVFNPTSNNFLNDNFVLKFTNYYDDDKYFSDEVLSQWRLAKNMYIVCKNIINFYKV